MEVAKGTLIRLCDPWRASHKGKRKCQSGCDKKKKMAHLESTVYGLLQWKEQAMEV